MTDLTCEFIKHLPLPLPARRVVDSTPQPYEIELRQLATVLKKLDHLSPAAIRSPKNSLRGWWDGLCAHLSPDRPASPATPASLDELKEVVEVIHHSVADKAQQLKQLKRAANSPKRTSLLTSIKNIIYLNDDDGGGDDESQDSSSTAAMSDILFSFLRDVKEFIKLHELTVLQAEVKEKEVMNTWRKHTLPALASAETESAANYAEATTTRSSQLDQYQYSVQSENKALVESILNGDDAHTAGEPPPVTRNDPPPVTSNEPPRPVTRSETGISFLCDDLPRAEDYYKHVTPDEAEVIAQANPRIQELRMLQERNNLEEESVLEISRKVERISELLSFFATEVDHQHAMSANILVVTKSAISNVASAQDELEKTMKRKVSWRRVIFMVYCVGGLFLLGLDVVKSGGFFIF